MSSRRESVIVMAWTTLGCTPPGPGFTLDEAGSDDASDEGDSTATTVDADGDGDGDETVGPNDVPFELVSAAMNLTGEFIALRFSEPVGSLEGVDPSDFRISLALPVQLCGGSGDCIDRTDYWDANFYVEYHLTYDPYYGPPPDGDRFEVDLLAPGNMPTDVILHFAIPLDPALCEYFEGYPDALYVHFAPGPIPLRSADDEPLAAIGPQWVDFDGPAMDVYGVFPNLDPQVLVPCP